MSSLEDNDYLRYFVPGYGISRHIILSHLHFYLGPYASARPYSYHGREGYLVIAPGQPLTKVTPPLNASRIKIQRISVSWVG